MSRMPHRRADFAVVKREVEDWGDNTMLDRQVLELVLISLLAVFGTGLECAPRAGQD